MTNTSNDKKTLLKKKCNSLKNKMNYLKANNELNDYYLQDVNNKYNKFEQTKNEIPINEIRGCHPIRS